MSEITIGKRLCTAAALVRRGARLADVGTDHAYLPIYLLEAGLIESAILSDVNEGPLEKARENVLKYGFSDKTELTLGSGASHLGQSGATDYTVCGMGGELIADIIENAPHLRSADINLVLQPMTRPELLRKYLWDNGFSILDERYATDEGKHYVCLGVRYSGVKEEYTGAELYFGKRPERALETEDGRAYINARLGALIRIKDGKLAGGKDASAEQEIIETITKILG